jgi:hypothetical protein
MSEDYRMSIYDAVAQGLTYFHSELKPREWPSIRLEAHSKITAFTQV